MSEDDDWFESATAGDDAADADETTDENDATDGDDAAEEAVTDDETADADDAADTDSARSDAVGDESDDANGDGAFDAEDGVFGEGDAASGFGEGDAEDDDPFGGDGSSPFDADGDEGSPFDAGGDDESPFDAGGDEGSPFGGDSDGGDGGEGGELFDDDFASAFGSAGGSGGGDEFDDEDFESEIPRLDLGIEGLDDMIQGGIPRRHLIVTIGSAGTGKTTFGLQFLHHGLQQEDTEKAVFITLEQSHDAIMATADERDWDFERYEEEDELAIVDLDPVEMANSLQNIQAELPELIRDFGADRLVLDSVSLLEMMYDNQARRRTQVFDFTRSLKKAGVTTMLTSEASESSTYASRHGIIEYLTDAVVHLRYVRQETRETRMAVEIQKIRNANHSRETKPYEITGDGISVYQQANIF
ncbi:KaiC domain-containing protein [Halorientalis halophila]|uniref:KaiC domain-containing protein n=1 Tax=Halorientalis halophila TaxID=3108499 RepID=UPI003009E348